VTAASPSSTTAISDVTSPDVFMSALMMVMMLQGIKVTDADSKKKAIKLLKAEQAMKQMDIDSDASDSGSDVEMK